MFKASLFFCVSAAASIFNLPSVENLNESELTRLIQSQSPVDKATGEYFLSERYFLIGKPHAAELSFSRALAICQSLQAPICELVNWEARRGQPYFLKYLSSKPAEFQSSATDVNDKLYFEARNALNQEPGLGLDIRKALVNFEALRRLLPKQTSVLYFQAKAHALQQNYRYQEFLNEGLAQNDVRSGLVNENMRQVFFDGMGSSWNANLFFNPSVGMGIQGRFSDTHLWDTARDVDSLVGIATGPALFGRVGFEDKTVFEETGLGVQSQGYLGDQDDYGLGPNTKSEMKQRIRRETVGAELFAKRYFLNDFFLKVGWLFKLDSNQNVSGPTGELAVDTRNSRYSPSQGVYASIRGLFGSFERVDFYSETALSLWRGQTLRLRLGVSHSTSDTPYFEQPDNSMNGWIPGIRLYRFRDKAQGAFSPEWRSRLGAVVTLCGFGTLGNVNSSVGTLLSETPKLGGGIASEFSFSRALSDRSRIEVGVYAGELNASAGWVMGF